VQLVRRSDAELEINALREVMSKAITALEDEQAYKAHTMLFDALYGETHNAELCGGPSGPSERAPGYASGGKD